MRFNQIFLTRSLMKSLHLWRLYLYTWALSVFLQLCINYYNGPDHWAWRGPRSRGRDQGFSWNLPAEQRVLTVRRDPLLSVSWALQVRVTWWELARRRAAQGHCKSAVRGKSMDKRQSFHQMVLEILDGNRQKNEPTHKPHTLHTN